MKVKNKYLKKLKFLRINDHPYSINSGYLLFFKTAIMGNTADMAMVQKASRVTTLRHLQEKGWKATSEIETSSEASYLG